MMKRNKKLSQSTTAGSDDVGHGHTDNGLKTATVILLDHECIQT